MSQSKVSSYYTARKKRTDIKLLKGASDRLKVNTQLDLGAGVDELKTTNVLNKSSVGLTQSSIKPPKLSAAPTDVPSKVIKASKTTAKPKLSKTTSKLSKSKTQTKSKIQTKNRAEKEPDIRESFRVQGEKSYLTENRTESVDSVLNLTYTIEKEASETEEVLVRSPKRNLPIREETDSKKKKKQDAILNTPTSVTNEIQFDTPAKHIELSEKRSVRKSLFTKNDGCLSKKSSEELTEIANNKDNPVPAERLDFLKEQLSKFDKTYKKIKEFKSNKCKITSVVSLNILARPEAEDKKLEETLTPAYIKYHNLAESPDVEIKRDLSDPKLLEILTLPYKYKLLSKTFQCSDTVVNMLYNRREVCTFNKLKNGVQDMTKRTFSKSNLGQIKRVYPLAYSYQVEKNSSAVRNRNPGTPLYELVITPILREHHQGNTVEKLKTNKKSSNIAAFIPMTPALLIERKRIFMSNLLTITLRHHQNFLARLNPPVLIPINKITKWHPKFNIDGIPDIEPAELPEPPHQPVASTANNIFNKLKETAGEKVAKALQKVTQESGQVKEPSTPSVPEKKQVITHQLLKNVSSDILARVRARESAKIIEDMTKAPKDKKRMEMLERLPELIRILRIYFITERKAAISLEDATQKVLDSYHASMNPEDVKQHLQLIADTFPKWLSLIPIRKGLFLKIDKAMDINDLLNNMPTE